VDTTESPVLIDVWTVASSRQPELVQRIRDITRDLMIGHPGFVAAQIYESDDGAVMVSVTMRTIKDRQALTDSPEAHAALREMRMIAHSHVRLFRLVESFGEPV
jgi:hypothetical protein